MDKMEDETVVDPKPTDAPAQDPKDTPAPAPEPKPDADPNTQPAPDDKKGELKQEPKPHKDRFQARINQLTSKIKILEARLEGNIQTRVDPQDQQIQKPNREQFQDDAGYIDALTDYKLSLRLPEVQRNLNESARNTTSQMAFQAKEILARKDIEDYDDAIAEAADIPVQSSVADAILSSDVGPHLRYYLATHPDEAEALNNMSAGAAARQIGRIEAKVESEIAVKKTAAPKKVSGAPSPVKPVKAGGDGTPAIDVNDPKLPIDEFMKQRRLQREKAHAPLKRTA